MESLFPKIIFCLGFAFASISIVEIFSELILAFRLKQKLIGQSDVLPTGPKRLTDRHSSLAFHAIRNPIGFMRFYISSIDDHDRKAAILTTTILTFLTIAGTVFWAIQSIFSAFNLGILGAVAIFYFQIRYYERQHHLAIMAALPQAVDGLIRCLSSGFDMNRSLTIVAEESPSALRSEFRYLLRNRDYGQSLGHAFDVMAQRLKSPDISFLASLIAVQERSGGRMAEALESLSSLLKDREKLRQKRMTASAEARMSALILGGLPVLVAASLFSFNTNYREVLIGTEAGRLFLLLGVTLLIIGTYVMYRMVRMDIKTP